MIIKPVYYIVAGQPHWDQICGWDCWMPGWDSMEPCEESRYLSISLGLSVSLHIFLFSSDLSQYFSCLGICAFWLCCFGFPGLTCILNVITCVFHHISYISLTLSLLLYLSLSLVSSLNLFVSLSLLSIVSLSMSLSASHALSLYIPLCLSRYLCLSPTLSFYLRISLNIFALTLYCPLSWNLCMPILLFQISRAHRHSECVSSDSLTLVVIWCRIKIVNSQFMINNPVYYIVNAWMRPYGTLWREST